MDSTEQQRSIQGEAGNVKSNFYVEKLHQQFPHPTLFSFFHELFIEQLDYKFIHTII